MAFAPTPFAKPVVSPDTATLFRRTPYISASEYRATPTAVATKGLVPGGSESDSLAALAAVIARASDWVDTLCFHRADGTLAASPATESGWITLKAGGRLALICNFKPILEVDGLALGTSGAGLANIGEDAAQAITISGSIIYVAAGAGGLGPAPWFPSVPTVNGKVYAVWTYVNGYPHTFLAAEADAKDESIEVGPSVPGGSKVYGVYPGTQLTIHDGASTEVIVVSSVEGLKLNLGAGLAYDHALPAAPDATRVSAVPWIVEQACISLVSCLIKMRGSRAMVLPQSPSSSGPSKQAVAQSGGLKDYETAVDMLRAFTTPVMRST
jgi:hypothetical protein